MDQSIPDLAAATLSELGLPAPTNVIQTMLIHDGYFVGWKFRYDGGYAILRRRPHDRTVRRAGNTLRKVALDTEQEAA